jgi:hypothetical protein
MNPSVQNPMYVKRAKNVFCVCIGSRHVYLQADSKKSKYGDEIYWVGYDDFPQYKKHPSLKSAKAWIPENRLDPEWETAIHEFDVLGKLIAVHPI